MKRFLLLVLLVVSVSAFAQKRYVNVCANEVSDASQNNIYLSGAIPSDMKAFYHDEMYIGDILNMLAERGFVVEQMSCSDYNGYTKEIVILSTTSPSSQTQIEGDVNNDNEVNIADVNRVISLILGMMRENPNLLEELGIMQPK